MTVLAPTAINRALLCCDSSMFVYATQDRECSDVPRLLLPHLVDGPVSASGCEVFEGDGRVGIMGCSRRRSEIAQHSAASL